MTINARVFVLAGLGLAGLGLSGLALSGWGSAALSQATAGPNSGIIALPLQPIVPATQRSCSARTASGLGYTELRPATGPKAGPTDYVLINYIGYLDATGAVFDQNMRTPMKADGVIPGFSEGLGMIPRGGLWRFCIPAKLGYGAESTGPIPANADLVFQVELLDSRTAAEVEAMQRAAPANPANPASPADPRPTP